MKKNAKTPAKVTLSIGSLCIEMTGTFKPAKRSPRPKPNTRPSWLLARVRYQCDLIDLCAREVEARGQLTSDVPERATAALRRWADGSDAPGDRASWVFDPKNFIERTGIPMLYLGGMVREVVRTRIEGERASRNERDPKTGLLRSRYTEGHGCIGNRGLEADTTAGHLLRELNLDEPRVLELTRVPESVLKLDPGWVYELSLRAEAEVWANRLIAEADASR